MTLADVFLGLFAARSFVAAMRHNSPEQAGVEQLSVPFAVVSSAITSKFYNSVFLERAKASSGTEEQSISYNFRTFPFLDLPKTQKRTTKFIHIQRITC